MTTVISVKFRGGSRLYYFSPGEHNVENYMTAIAAVDGLVPARCTAT